MRGQQQQQQLLREESEKSGAMPENHTNLNYESSVVATTPFKNFICSKPLVKCMIKTIFIYVSCVYN